MEQVNHLSPLERVRLDHEKLRGLYDELGDIGAEDVLCRAMEQLARRLAQAEAFCRSSEFEEMHKAVHSLIGIATQMGMNTLARVAGDVCTCIERMDHVALSATFQRLSRTGESSLRAIWDLDEFCP